MPENREKHNGKSKFHISPTDRLDLLSALTKAQAVEQAKGKKHKKLLEQVDLFVMVALIGHRNNQTGQCNPSHATIAREIGVSVSSVQRSFKRLVKAGFIATTARYSNGSKASSQVDIAFKKGESWITKRDDDKSQMTDGPVTDDRRVQSSMTDYPVIDDHEVRSPMTDKRSAVNPEKEPSVSNPAASRREGPADLNSFQGHDPQSGISDEPSKSDGTSTQAGSDVDTRRYHEAAERCWGMFQKSPQKEMPEFIRQFVDLCRSGEIKDSRSFEFGIRQMQASRSAVNFHTRPLEFLKEKMWLDYNSGERPKSAMAI